MTFVSKTNIQEIKDRLQFKSKFSEHAANVKNKIANQLNSSVEDITFIGVHHRRTVSNSFKSVSTKYPSTYHLFPSNI